MSIDPGRAKFGWSFVSYNGELLLSGVEKTENLDFFFRIITHDKLSELDGRFLEGKLERVSKRKIKLIFLGNGTGKGIVLREKRTDIEIKLVEERGTTLGARKIFWNLHPPKGWRRMIPLSLQTPPRDIDDLAAYEIALRGIKELKMGEM